MALDDKKKRKSLKPKLQPVSVSPDEHDLSFDDTFGFGDVLTAVGAKAVDVVGIDVHEKGATNTTIGNGEEIDKQTLPQSAATTFSSSDDGEMQKDFFDGIEDKRNEIEEGAQAENDNDGDNHPPDSITPTNNLTTTTNNNTPHPMSQYSSISAITIQRVRGLEEKMEKQQLLLARASAREDYGDHG